MPEMLSRGELRRCKEKEKRVIVSTAKKEGQRMNTIAHHCVMLTNLKRTQHASHFCVIGMDFTALISWFLVSWVLIVQWIALEKTMMTAWSIKMMPFIIKTAESGTLMAWSGIKIATL